MNIAHLKGDIVDIEHAHKIENGYATAWYSTQYKYVGKKKWIGQLVFDFEDIEYNHIHFHMSRTREDFHRIIRKIK